MAFYAICFTGTPDRFPPVNAKAGKRCVQRFPAHLCAPGERTFYRVKVPKSPGEDLAKGKGVHREVESEESRILGVTI